MSAFFQSFEFRRHADNGSVALGRGYKTAYIRALDKIAHAEVPTRFEDLHESLDFVEPAQKQQRLIFPLDKTKRRFKRGLRILSAVFDPEIDRKRRCWERPLKID